MDGGDEEAGFAAVLSPIHSNLDHPQRSVRQTPPKVVTALFAESKQLQIQQPVAGAAPKSLARPGKASASTKKNKETQLGEGPAACSCGQPMKRFYLSEDTHITLCADVSAGLAAAA